MRRKTSQLLHLEILCFSLQPSRCQFVLLKVPLRLAPDVGTVVIEPGFLSLCQKTRVDELAAVWYHGDVFKSEVGLVTKLVFGLNLLDHDDIFNTNTKGAVFVVARFIRDNISRGQGDLRELYPSTNSNRALVDVQV